jgi:hypothetical protein
VYLHRLCSLRALIVKAQAKLTDALDVSALLASQDNAFGTLLIVYMTLARLHREIDTPVHWADLDEGFFLCSCRLRHTWRPAFPNKRITENAFPPLEVEVLSPVGEDPDLLD